MHKANNLIINAICNPYVEIINGLYINKSLEKLS
jgi:hypothetical protein